MDYYGNYLVKIIQDPIKVFNSLIKFGITQ